MMRKGMLFGLGLLAVAMPLAGCSDGGELSRSVCDGTVTCGHFSIRKNKESSPVFIASAATTPVYRLCVEEGSVILQTIEADGSAKSLGVEIRAGNCSEVSFQPKNYIIGNTTDGLSTGFYYRVP